MSIEIISTFIGLFLTLFVFSYLLGDNPLFRLTIHLFVGISSGYAAAVVIHSVLLPRLASLQFNDINQMALGVIPLVLSLLLLTKLFPRFSGIGSLSMAILVGVGAAVAVGGAVIGTLLPQAQASMDAFALSANSNFFEQLFAGAVMLLGTVATLASFQFSARRAPDGTIKRNLVFEGIAWVGRIFIAITLGVLFAGVYMAALTAMIERLSSTLHFIRSLIGL